MKLIILLVLILCIVFSACSFRSGSNNTDEGESYQTLIVTSFYPIYIFTLNIVGDIPQVKVINMTESQTCCLHDYQLMPKDLKALQKADIFVYNGAGLETFLDKVISQLPDLKLIEASKGISLIENSEGEVNPHVWVSISGAIAEVKNIIDGLAEADPSNGEQYKKNGQDYIERLESLKQKMHNDLNDIVERDIITFHEAFPYFAEEFDLNVVSVIEDESGSDFSAGELAQIIRDIEQSGVKILFAEPHNTEKAELIAKQTGTEVYILDPIESAHGNAAADSYEKAMLENLEVLKEALK
ncbi:MAG: zinc ABC transporter solute-binding protein [Clostridiaceae bacterium]|nr:zinc ABC transporter solute-binding protein [Clostridiaceae bacterium]